eukprot:10626197-Alexandrium_andersonii.AAC.1
MVLHACYMAAGDRREARRLTAGDGRAWTINLAANVLGWERDFADDGDVESRPGPRAQAPGTPGNDDARRPARDRCAWIRDLAKDGDVESQPGPRWRPQGRSRHADHLPH